MWKKASEALPRCVARTACLIIKSMWCDVCIGLDTSLLCSPQRTSPGTTPAASSCGRWWLQWPCVSWSSVSPSAFSCAAGSRRLSPPRDPCKEPRLSTVALLPRGQPPVVWRSGHSCQRVNMTMLLSDDIGELTCMKTQFSEYDPRRRTPIELPKELQLLFDCLCHVCATNINPKNKSNNHKDI